MCQDFASQKGNLNKRGRREGAGQSSSPTMGRGRPLKRKRNTSGLNKQSTHVSEAPRILPIVEEYPEMVIDSDEENQLEKNTPQPADRANEEEGLDQCWIDDEQTGFARWFGYIERDIDEMSEEECATENWEDNWFDDEKMQEILYKYAVAMDKDVADEDWVPESIKNRKKRRQQREQKSRPKEYAKGPDIAKKAPRTRRRYKAAMETQNSLEKFGFFGDAPIVKGMLAAANNPSPPPSSSAPSTSEPIPSTSSAAPRDPVEVDVPTNRPGNNNLDNDDDSEPITIRQETVEPTLQWDDPAVFVGTAADSVNAETQADLAGEAWEDELDENLGSATVEFRGWQELREQIKKDLTKGKKGGLPLSTSHEIALQWYEGTGSGIHFASQLFEQLPKEKRGGKRNSRTLLTDESTCKAARAWLTAQEVGTVTPYKFQTALNQTILPSLGITCEPRRWLVTLGWRLTVLRKGVYFDGHERPDVVKYRNKVFLPAMAKYECRMAKYEGPQLKRVEPILEPGEKEIITEWHDESSFHALEYKTSAWLGLNQTILQKKTRGRIVHVSDLINEVTGRLVVRDACGKIIRDAREIIYPGSQGDAWWDTAQLLEQIRKAISIFEEAHPNCQALFVFDQSSAHASLGPNALKAFEMNKNDGGKQRKQKDTIIPQSNPTVELRGKPQKMTLPDGKPKGMKRVLEERGFDVQNMKAKCSPVCPFENETCCMARLLSKQDDFVNQPSMLETLITEAGHNCIFLPKFHCELNPIEMYWGWVKYRYRQVPKVKFQDAKDTALEYLNACPVDVIRRFINRSWRFMSAYRIGLKGKAAEWAVRKQKGHRAVSASAMMQLEAVLDPN
ncbi:hypothetical protein BT96DRAFT_967294 [Gymnopus androsaceus JB14]|uniref:Tc1-like transposase DDE domain-containing protein n=1 Tax=Gymnopus androsaceus JB14 TaxID=1447944 RepID=A0A6A4H4C0_9AGAR|nr:hypothetical protein BT96DRAFT_967294 [Gymnopus androsaceus JB14]